MSFEITAVCARVTPVTRSMLPVTRGASFEEIGTFPIEQNGGIVGVADMRDDRKPGHGVLGKVDDQAHLLDGIGPSRVQRCASVPSQDKLMTVASAACA